MAWGLFCSYAPISCLILCASLSMCSNSWMFPWRSSTCWDGIWWCVVCLRWWPGHIIYIVIPSIYLKHSLKTPKIILVQASNTANGTMWQSIAREATQQLSWVGNSSLCWAIVLKYYMSVIIRCEVAKKFEWDRFRWWKVDYLSNFAIFVHYETDLNSVKYIVPAILSWSRSVLSYHL